MAGLDNIGANKGITPANEALSKLLADGTSQPWRPQTPNTQYNWNSPGQAQNPKIEQSGRQERAGGQTRTGEGANLYDPHRTDIDYGLQMRGAFAGNMVYGGVSGVAFGGPVPWILNRTADSILTTPEQRAAFRSGAPIIADNGAAGKILPEGVRISINESGEKFNAWRDRFSPAQNGALGKTAKWYQENFDSRYFRRSDLVLYHDQFADLDRQVQELIKTNTAKMGELSAQLGNGKAATDAQLAELSRLTSRNSWLNSEQWKENGAKHLESLRASMYLNEQGLFTEAEMKTIADRQTARTSVTNIMDVQAKEQKFWGETPGSNFVKGAGFVGVTMVADHYLDKIFTGKDHQDGLTHSSMTETLPLVGDVTKSWSTNALLVPMAFTTGGFETFKDCAVKAAYTGAALVGGKVLDNLLPASDHQSYSNWLKPTGFDSVLMGAAFLLPAAENKTRLSMIGGAWALGRIYNMFEGPTKYEIKDEGFSRMKTDMKDRTASSMNAAIDGFKEFGEKDNYALRLYTSDWLRPNRQYDGMLSAYRGAVILADAFGESRLDKGTLLPKSTKDFILPGRDLDIGAQATRALIVAQVNIDRAKQQTRNELGKDEKGKKVSEQELRDLDEIGKRVNSALQNRVYGKHDIEGAVNELADAYKGNQQEMVLLKMDLDNSLALNRGSKNTQFTAKLFRDQACILLAIAQLKASGPDAMGAQDTIYGTSDGRKTQYNNGQQRGYDGALDAIALAKQLDPNNPDNVELEQVANRLKSRLPLAVQDQQSNPIFNPLNVNDQVSNPGSQNPFVNFGTRR
ncbi:MAG: hypothetical protein EKK48_23380 [Candidatus Melainabacteria bacterium]|nr:MAG: hypothetical protein EKK48_23380 [Candidatus Melainabacteria bacterium]